MEGKRLNKKVAIWVSKNKYLICSALNEARNYSTSQVRAESVCKVMHDSCECLGQYSNMLHTIVSMLPFGQAFVMIGQCVDL